MLSQQQILDLAANKEGDYSTSQLLGAYNTGEIDAVNAPSVPLLSSESGGEQIQKDLARLNEYTQPKTIGGTQYFQQADGSYKAVGGNLAPGSGKTDKESGVKSPFGFNEQGQAIQNPNANGTDAFSPEQLTAAGITDPIGEGLLFDPSRQVYYVSNTAPSETQAKIKGQAQSTQASTALASDESWAMSEMKKAITGVDALLADTLGNIQADYQNRKLQLEQMNNASIGRLQTSGYRYGTTRYSSQLQDQLLSVEERAGIQKLSELATEAQTLVIKAKQAAASGKYDSLYKYMTLIDKKREEQAAATEKLAKLKTEQDKKIIESRRTATLDSAIGDLLSQGVTDPRQILDVLNFNDKGQMIGDATSKEVADAINNLLPKEAKKDPERIGTELRDFEYLKEKGLLPKVITGLPENEQPFAWLTRSSKGGVANKAEETAAGLTGAAGFEKFTNEQIALSVIPVQLRNTEVELNRFLEGIRMGLSQGKTPYEVADALMGYKINEPSDFSNGLRQYFAPAGLDSSQINDVARLVNQGANDKAISVIENAAYKQARTNLADQYVAEATVQYTSKKTDEIRNTIKKLGDSSPVGVVKGTMQDWLGRLRGKEAAEVRAKMTSLVAEMRNRLSGTAVTESEQAFLEPLIPKLGDSPDNFMKKIAELENDPLMRLNSVRQQYELPKLDKATLRDRKLRTPLYSIGEEVKTITNDPLGINTETETNTDDPLNLGI